jgi:hypothetical protein
MRPALVVALLVLPACGWKPVRPATVAAGATAAASPAGVTDVERQRMKKAVIAWLDTTMHEWQRGDSAGLMNSTYPTAGGWVSIGDGLMYTNRDSVARFLGGLSRIADKKIGHGTPTVDVLAPGVAALAVTYRAQGKPPKMKPFDTRAAYTAVLLERNGQLQILQEHTSSVRP